MESTSMGNWRIAEFGSDRIDRSLLAFRIHSSETTAALLEEIGGFHLDYRGITEIKVSSSFPSVQKQT